MISTPPLIAQLGPRPSLLLEKPSSSVPNPCPSVIISSSIARPQEPAQQSTWVQSSGLLVPSLQRPSDRVHRAPRDGPTYYRRCPNAALVSGVSLALREAEDVRTFATNLLLRQGLPRGTFDQWAATASDRVHASEDMTRRRPSSCPPVAGDGRHCLVYCDKRLRNGLFFSRLRSHSCVRDPHCDLGWSVVVCMIGNAAGPKSDDYGVIGEEAANVICPFK
ncbi:hypothetical protein K466DRAFT_101785 [Polyporus arcularius HHB13444]|uniref:Uncharacterized protein n=1 Tax=Polyporus arcularius HHB13444 TaxID=1314778 RepID=A0A5C3PP03_9APHY|nr:hypothetical protein K466DRAFT_101785 [Polyporus arcularius HHB13444]